jgi:hypothetical protein
MTEKKAILLAVHDGQADIRTEDGETLRFDAARLPLGAREGAELRLRLVTAESETAERGTLAAAVLNELLQGGRRAAE